MKDPDLCSPSERISDYAKRRKELRGLSTDEIHGIDSQPNGGYELRLSDIEWQSKRIAELEAQAKAIEWQPISTAPKDGTRVLLFWPLFGNNEHQEFGRWDTQSYNTKPKPFWTGDMERVYGIGWYRRFTPSHWMPLPEPPSSTCESA